MEISATHEKSAPGSLSQALATYVIILRAMMAEYRSTWYYHIFFGMFLPIGLAFLLKTGIGLITVGNAIYMLGGNMVISIVYGPTTMLISKIGWGKEFHEFDYWATLPIPRTTLILAITSVYLLFAAPGLIVAYMIGSWIFTLPLLGGIFLPGVAILGVLALSGFGAMLGLAAKNGQIAGIYGNIFIAVATFLSPLMIPQEKIPILLRLMGWLLPTTYVADAFRQALTGNIGPAFLYDIVFLICFAIISFTLIHFKFDWRKQ